MTRSEVVARAMRCVGKEIRYKLGKGGFNPKAARFPGQECDCSGFVAWCYGVSRIMKDHPAYVQWNGGWFETTAVWRDIQSEAGIVEEVLVSAVLPGDLVVMPDRGGKQGHIGIISDSGLVWKDLRVIHCSPGNEKRTGSAVAETGMWAVPGDVMFGKVQWVDD